ncbi:GntR family transcriptional regulator [Atlantibacter hermannii]|uniref:GntR family transcriptional regulator n=1 Tax=Atlantibacter hermannii TaxID=565 RepID=UPI0005C1C015|nr:GntR family transcriptional regulator [Atlantibacter hermannii]MCQ4967598.1 GntR family transcriptional regulator [Enterobacteriaceae bacterium DFI.7.85]KIU35766.1 GntR family transcriptional regulator [Atlantibacter hermannii]MBW9431791.1 GntR family transcriptional regulator [Atlantibacter hermannii]MDU7388608.1 GntR family transcriptional regulator [Atlantibacter hermannii]WIF56453.1 GntR family transcriptional regulator [Atlantibacter hermannii]
MLDLERAQRMSLTTQVEVRLKNALIIGSLKPGSRLVTKDLAEQLGTSITPVREALLRLVSAGALVATPAQAFLVPEISEECFMEINLVRKNLEGLAVEKALEKMTADDVIMLRNLWNKFDQAKQSGEVEQSMVANRVFRFELYKLAQMPTLHNLIEQLWVQIGPCFNFLHPQLPKMEQCQYNYYELIDALESRDPERCVKAVHQVIDDSNYLVSRYYYKSLS